MSSASEFAQDFGVLIERYIDAQGLSRKEVAFRIWGDGERAGHVTAYIGGKRGKPGPPLIRKFADALGIPDAEIQALRTRERAAAAEEAAALNIPLGFLDAMAELFGGAESFAGWDAYASFMRDKAGEYTRLLQEVQELRQTNPATENRIPQIEALLADGRIADAESVLVELRETATDEALEGIRDLSRIMALQADAALLRQDADEAFDLYRNAAALFDTLAPLEGAILRNTWEDRLYQHGLRYGGQGLEHSAALLTLNLDTYAREDHPRQWANTQNSLAIALAQAGERTEGESGTDLLARAVAAFEAALEVRTREADPERWARTQMNLGNALQLQAERRDNAAAHDLLARAVRAFEAALEVQTRQTDPDEWARTQMNLGVALVRQGQRTEGAEGLDLFTRAVTAFEAALEVRTREGDAENWAMTQMNLGIALELHGGRTEGAGGLALLTRAIAAYAAALEVRTRDASPVEWGKTQENLAGAHLTLARRQTGAERGSSLAQALAAVDSALEVFEPETMGAYRALSLHDRDLILAEMGKGGDG